MTTTTTTKPRRAARTCETCRYYEHEPITDRAVAAREEAGTRARGPMLRARRGGYCYRRKDELTPTGVPHGRDLVDAGDWCGSHEEAAPCAS